MTTLPSPSAYVPYFQLRYSDQLTFWERLNNLYTKAITMAEITWHFRMTADPFISSRLPKSPPTADLFAGLSGLLINHNDVIDYPRPKPPTFVNILGMALKDDFPPLPKVRECFSNFALS